MFQNIAQIVKKKVIFSMISNGEKRKGKSKGCKAKLKGQRWH